MTNGLVRWWPNLFDVRDEITGQEGAVSGVLPLVDAGAADETEFSRHTGWVQLQPAITNEVFTLAFWVRCHADAGNTRLLGQQSGDVSWMFQHLGGAASACFVGSLQIQEIDRTEEVTLKPEVWQHVAIARKPDGRSVVWVDGARALEGRLSHPWPTNARWLTVGDSFEAGLESTHHGLRDLLVFDRELADEEVRSLQAAGLPQRPARNTPSRLASTRRSIPVHMATNAIAAPSQLWAHRRFTTEDGLPGNVVRAVLQARDGYLWVGTEGGLARFDGQRFRAFTAENTPAMKAIGETVWSLSEDDEGTIWAGIFGGLLRIRDLEFTAFTNGLPQRFILQAEPAGDGSLWVAGFNAFVPRGPLWLRRYHPDSGTSSAEVVVPGHVRRIVPATHGNGVWLATEQPQQIRYWDGQSPSTVAVAIVDLEPPSVRIGSHVLPVPSVSGIQAWSVPGGNSSWWAEVRFGSDGPVFHWLWDSRLHRPFAARWNGPVGADDWLGVLFGLARIREGRLESLAQLPQLTGQELACLCSDREGGVWFGSEQDGLHFVRERLIRTFTTAEGLDGNDVRSVCASPAGGLWVGTGEGLSRFKNGEWSERTRGKVLSVASDSQGRPWFGLGQFGADSVARDRWGAQGGSLLLGLDWQDPNSIMLARDGTLWVACERGLTWVKPDRLTQGADGNWRPGPASREPVFGRYAVGKELPRMFPVGLVADRDGAIWLGSLGRGLFRVNDGQVENFSTKDGLAAGRCVPVYDDRSGSLWIVSDGALSRRVGGRFQTIYSSQGLPRDLFLDLLEDDLGNLWMSGKRGVHRVARSEVEEVFAGRLSQVHALTLGARDGLLTPECSSLGYPTMAKTPDGHVWVATRNGLATFDARRVHVDTQPLPSLIEQLVVNRREIPFFKAPRPGRRSTRGEAAQDGNGGRVAGAAATAADAALRASARTIRLEAGSGERLEFHYTAVSLEAPERVKFRYRLDGYDADWSPETDLRLAFYTNLRPRAYRFRVKAANPHGIWSDDEAALSFVILPYFWQTTPFRASVVLALLALAGGLHWRRLAWQRRDQEAKHRQALTSEKARIAADMHDELGAALTQIAILGEVARRQATKGAPPHSTLERISQAAREATTRMSDLVWATNPRNDALDNLAAYLREHAASQLEDTPVASRLEFPVSMPESHVSAIFRRNLLLVLKEALHNAIKHARATQITVRMEIAGADLLLRVEDDGCGFDPSSRAGSGNGLGNMKKRTRDLGGELVVESSPGHGTRLLVRAPWRVR